jgi:hypothetical protein
MSSVDARLEALFHLFEAAEEMYPYVTVPRLRRLARAERDWAPLSGSMAALVRDALEKGALFSDKRLQLTRSGSLRAVRVYRLNRRHELVATVLGGF